MGDGGGGEGSVADCGKGGDGETGGCECDRNATNLKLMIYRLWNAVVGRCVRT